MLVAEVIVKALLIQECRRYSGYRAGRCSISLKQAAVPACHSYLCGMNQRLLSPPMSPDR